MYQYVWHVEKKLDLWKDSGKVHSAPRPGPMVSLLFEVELMYTI